MCNMTPEKTIRPDCGRLRKTIVWLAMVPALLIPSSACFAEGGAVIMEACTNEADLSVYVKNVESSPSDVAVLVGTNQEAAAACESIADTPFETLILIDNSLSIPNNMRGVTVKLLDALFQAKAPNEKMAVGVFEKEIKYLVEFTDDYGAFKAAVVDTEIPYQNQNTYITDMICKLWEDEYKGSSRDVYRRILIIADGVDDESIGYTDDEWNQLIAEDTYPIYTVGYKTKNNNAQLERLFALSRQSNAESFQLDSEADIPSAVEAMGRDRDIVKVVVSPPANLRDGSKVSVKIDLAGQSVSKEMRMPQQGLEEEEAPPVEPVMEEEAPEEPEPEPEIEVPDDSDALRQAAVKKFIVIVIAAWIVILSFLLIVVMVRRMKKKRQSEEEYANGLRRQRENELEGALPEGGSMTTVVLTDPHRQGKCFRASLAVPVVVGYSRQQCGIVLDYSKFVSGRHCLIYEMDGKVMIKDLASTNGTFVNGTRIFSETPLQHGATIVLGQLELTVEITRN